MSDNDAQLELFQAELEALKNVKKPEPFVRAFQMELPVEIKNVRLQSEIVAVLKKFIKDKDIELVFKIIKIRGIFYMLIEKKYNMFNHRIQRIYDICAIMNEEIQDLFLQTIQEGPLNSILSLEKYDDFETILRIIYRKMELNEKLDKIKETEKNIFYWTTKDLFKDQIVLREIYEGKYVISVDNLIQGDHIKEEYKKEFKPMFVFYILTLLNDKKYIIDGSDDLDVIIPKIPIDKQNEIIRELEYHEIKKKEIEIHIDEIDKEIKMIYRLVRKMKK